jgi:hypothetical protein
MDSSKNCTLSAYKSIHSVCTAIGHRVSFLDDYYYEAEGRISNTVIRNKHVVIMLQYDGPPKVLSLEVSCQHAQQRSRRHRYLAFDPPIAHRHPASPSPSSRFPDDLPHPSPSPSRTWPVGLFKLDNRSLPNHGLSGLWNSGGSRNRI